MEYCFDYLIEKISEADFSSSPFKHIYLDDFFSEQHFSEIISSSEVSIAPTKNDEDLLNKIQSAGWKVIKFPGCTTDIEKYLEWHASPGSQRHHSATEGFGMATRLYTPSSRIIAELNEFITSRRFYECIANKFSIDMERCRFDGGIQKYLDGYEISPHPDVRRKAATFMVNINPFENSESESHHTHYLKLTPEREYVKTFWEGNLEVDRCWLPWEWTETVSQQNKNNSIVLFSPSNNTLHGVKASYDHLSFQRTQLYGNLWYDDYPKLAYVEWEDLDLTKNARNYDLPEKKQVKNKMHVGERNI